MKKIMIMLIGIGIISVIFISFFFIRNTKNENIEDNPEKTYQIFEKGLGSLCTVEKCEEHCSYNRFACEVYCIQNPKNSYCKERFSYLYTSKVEQSLMRFPELRNYNYTFKDGKLQEKEPRLENLGVEIDFYNPSTNRAGDFVFNKFFYPWGEVYNTKVFIDYGEIENKNGTIERSPQLVYIVPLGTKVRSIASGVVTEVKLTQGYSNDYTIFVVNPETPSWNYEHEHVINSLVKEGDYVIAGQVLAEVSNYSQWLRNDGYGVVDIGLLKPARDYPGHNCPLLYLEESVKQNYFEKIKALYKSWEEYMNNNTLYDENNYVIPGCIIDELL